MHQQKFVYVSYIKTTPEELWEALTGSEFTRQYHDCRISPCNLAVCGGQGEDFEVDESALGEVQG
jgi:uncharacterized protein YndB with AHSA1/START domain